MQQFEWTDELRRRFIFIAVNNDPVHPGAVICPIYNRSVQHSGVNCQLVGTAFFVSPLGIFLTAKHVAEAIDQSDQPFLLQAVNGGAAVTERQIMFLPVSEKSDIGAGRVRAYRDRATGNLRLYDCMALTTKVPDLDEDISTMAHPHGRVTDEDGMQSGVWNPIYSSGKLVEYFPISRGGLLNHRCWRTNMRIPPGASGGPVVNKDGVVFAVNSSEFEYSASDFDSYITPITDMLQLALPDGDVMLQDGSGQVRPDLASMMVPLHELADQGIVFVPPLAPAQLSEDQYPRDYPKWFFCFPR